jgi:2-iminobutanoate/2-iminopropanoate deaminase
MMKRMITCALALGALGGCANIEYTAPVIAPVMESISVPGGRTLGPYSQAVRAGDYVFLSGIIALNSKTGKFAAAKIEPQTRQVFANLKDVLAAAGLGLDDVVKTTVFLKDPKDFASMNAVYAEYFKDHKPARSTVPGMDWGRPDLLIEIEVVAYAPRR